MLGHLGVLGRGCSCLGGLGLGSCLGHSNVEHNGGSWGPGVDHVGWGVLGLVSVDSCSCLGGPGLGHGCVVVFKVLVKLA